VFHQGSLFPTKRWLGRAEATRPARAPRAIAGKAVRDPRAVDVEFVTSSRLVVPLVEKVYFDDAAERLNKGIKRRTDVVGIFPGERAIIRIVGSTLAEQHDSGLVRRGFCAELLTSLTVNRISPEDSKGEAGPACSEGGTPRAVVQSTGSNLDGAILSASNG
jgi:Transposase, Mutator family